MSEQPTGGQPEAGTPTGAEAAGNAPPAAPKIEPEAGTGARAMDPEAVSRLVAAEVRPLKGQLKDLQAERDTLLAEKKARDEAEMTELERERARAQELAQANTAALAVAAEATRQLHVERAVREVNPGLPGEFLASIAAAEPEEIKAAVVAANERWQALLAQHAPQPPAAPPPISVGAPSNPPGQAPATTRSSADVAKELAACTEDMRRRSALLEEWKQARDAEQRAGRATT